MLIKVLFVDDYKLIAANTIKLQKSQDFVQLCILKSYGKSDSFHGAVHKVSNDFCYPLHI